MNVRLFRRLLVRGMIVSLVLCSIHCAVSSVNRNVKRIVNGEPLTSLNDFGTYHFVHIRNVWACFTNQAQHPVEGCIEQGYCAGTIIHPQFVLTAGHCLTYKEFFQRNISQIYDLGFFLGTNFPGLTQKLDSFGRRDEVVRDIMLTPTFRHSFYSNLGLFAGSIDLYSMTQKRHASKVFPHPAYSRPDLPYTVRNESFLDQDLALTQACEPFDITKEVRVAPMMPLDMLEAQWEAMVKTMPACLYVGFGTLPLLKYPLPKAKNRKVPGIMQYTWRHLLCNSDCIFNETHPLGWQQPRNTCKFCTRPIRPMNGSGSPGDSGGPVTCCGYYIGTNNGGVDTPRFLKESVAYGQALVCIKDAITPERIAYYLSVPEGNKYHPMGPVLNRRFHLH